MKERVDIMKEVNINNKYKLKVGDMIIYNYLGSDLLKGRVLDLRKDKVEIEIGICHKKSEDIYTDKVIASYDDVLPMAIGLKLKQ